MLTLRASASLLRTASDIDGLTRVAAAMGFDAPAVLDAGARNSLGLENDGSVALARGPGSLRALLLDLPRGTRVRETLARHGTRLTAEAPHVLWVLLAVERDGSFLGIAAPRASIRGAKTAALVADRGSIVDSDAETLRLLAASRSANDLEMHARFVDALGRDALSRRFFRTLDGCISGIAESSAAGSSAARREIALLHTSRLLFLAFLESKGWLDGDGAFLARSFDDCMASGGGFHGRVMLPLFFGTLNTPTRRRAARARAFGSIPFLNGGLFTPTAVEREHRRLRFGDEALGRIFGDLFSKYRFTAREETSTFEEAAIDPEMLGRTFECLMADETRRDSGAFYTPHQLVERVTQCGLDEAIGDSPTLATLEAMKVLDPACGSGAFLVHVLDRIAALRAEAGELSSIEVIRRSVLATSIFGVDVNPTAVWLCQLRLWLSIVIDTPASAAIPPLPNLDRNIRVGDSLLGASFEDARAIGGTALRRLRDRYVRSTGRRKVLLSRALDREERRLAADTIADELTRVSQARRDLLVARRGHDLFGARYVASREEARASLVLRSRSAELRRRLAAVRRGGPMPFSFAAHFADVAAADGFTLIVGNPPWVRPHRLDQRLRDHFRARYSVARAAPWAAGAEAAGAGRGFSSQVDVAALFVERSLRLLAPGAPMSLLLPAKLWRSLAGGGLRDLLATQSSIRRIEDYSDMPASFDAAVYPGLLVASRLPSRSSDAPVRIEVLHRATTSTGWEVPRRDIPFNRSPGAPWLLLPREARHAFDALSAAGEPLASSHFGRPLLGVKCGLNDAFVVRETASVSETARIVARNGREAELSRAALRPVIRGEAVRRWTVPPSEHRIVWTHGADGAALRTLPADLSRWFSPHRRALAARSDAARAGRWWSLFRVESASCVHPRVIWADIGRSLRAAFIEAGDPAVPLNTCYALACRDPIDALALCALFNSPLATAWLSVLAEPARGGYRRYLGWTMALFPVPLRWSAARETLAETTRRAISGGSVTDGELLDASVAAYGVRRRDVDALLVWATP